MVIPMYVNISSIFMFMGMNTIILVLEVAVAHGHDGRTVNTATPMLSISPP